MPIRFVATLPALGSVPIDFHSESATLWEYMGQRERRRLRDVPHLGVAASVFTGINHSRLEYTLLQCAVIGLIAKLHKDEEGLALAAKVSLNGLKSKVSSAEELLKIWALLSNYGHTQYTYGVERSLLQFARDDKEFQSWLVRSTNHKDLVKWNVAAIDNYSDEKMHLVLCMRRLASEAPKDRRKTPLFHYIRNLVLPLENLFADDIGQRYKLSRLRALYAKVRFLSMVTLDSYYSGHPFRLELGAAINGLVGLGAASGDSEAFERMLLNTAAWLADELYLHPTAVAAQREYEVRVRANLAERYRVASKTRSSTARLIRQILNDGLGKPQPDRFQPLLRLTFSTPRQRLLGAGDLYTSLKALERELCNPPATYLSIDKNRYSGSVHIDLFTREGESKPVDVAATIIKLRRWLVRGMEADALTFVRRFFPATERSALEQARLEAFRRRNVERQILEATDLLPRIFWAVIAYILPIGWTARVSEFIPDGKQRSPIAVRVRGEDNRVYDFASPRVGAQLLAGSPSVPPDRAQELRALQHALERSTDSPLTLVCAEKFIIRDQYGKHKDDWDGVLVEVTEADVFVTIVEAKNVGSRNSNETLAYNQLDATRELLRRRHPLPYRRTRIRGVGAQIRFQLK